MTKSNRAIIDFKDCGYTVRNDGVPLTPDGREMPVRTRLDPLNKKYYCIVEYKPSFEPNKKMMLYLHRIVAYLKFGFELLKSGIQARHKNDDGRDNSWDNILVGDQHQNMADISDDRRRAKARLAVQTDKTRGFRLTDEQAVEAFFSSETAVAIAKRLGCNPSTIWRLRLGNNHKNIITAAKLARGVA